MAKKKQNEQLFTDFNCRYKELTWVKKNIGRSSNLNYSAEFKKHATTTLRGTSTAQRTSKMSDTMRAKTLEPIGAVHRPC